MQPNNRNCIRYPYNFQPFLLPQPFRYVKAIARKGAIEFFMKEYHKALDTYQGGCPGAVLALPCHLCALPRTCRYFRISFMPLLMLVASNFVLITYS
jgi:hypothetical protein